MPRRKALPPVPIVEEEEEFTGSNHPPPDAPASLYDEVDRLMRMGEAEMLAEARRAAIRHLLVKLKEATISAPELAVLRNLLRDNGLILGMDRPDEAGGEPANPVGFHLPDLDAEDDGDEDHRNLKE